MTITNPHTLPVPWVTKDMFLINRKVKERPKSC